METGKKYDADYVLGHSAQELERLSTQARLYEPFTVQFFRNAGIQAGMRVLDVGCGSGDVSFLVALVGPTGQVVGVDRAPSCGGDIQWSFVGSSVAEHPVSQGRPERNGIRRAVRRRSRPHGADVLPQSS